MSGHMRKHHTSPTQNVMPVQYLGGLYLIPLKVAEKYRVDDNPMSINEVFGELDEKYSKPGVLLKGIRVRENLTQVQMAKKIKVTQSDISQMENGTRVIGKNIAKRIEKLFDVDYRSFLE